MTLSLSHISSIFSFFFFLFFFFSFFFFSFFLFFFFLSFRQEDYPVNTDPHLVAGLLKKYLRDLPEPLMTYELFDGSLVVVVVVVGWLVGGGDSCSCSC